MFMTDNKYINYTHAMHVASNKMLFSVFVSSSLFIVVLLAYLRKYTRFM